MGSARRINLAGGILALAALAVMAQGCSVGRYFQYRAQDFLDIPEIGITVTETPQVGLYWNSLDLLVAGYSDLDGTFIGWGGRHLGVVPIRSECYGLVLSRERVQWGDTPMRERYGGLAGVPGIVSGVAQDGRPLDSPACVHFIPHIGYVGLVWNLRWGQILDFVVGWTTIDLNGDDGPPAARPPGA